MPVLDKDRTSTKTGRLWVYVGDPAHEHIVFDYTPDRSRDGPRRFLSGYKGYLQADAYAGYDVVYAGQEVIEVACWAHARRKFFDSMKSDAARGRIALAYIRSLYAVEKRARDLENGERRELRVAEAKPQLEAFKIWLDAEAMKVLPKSPVGEAIGYALAQWVALTRYLEDGLLEPDNNRAERALRRVQLGVRTGCLLAVMRVAVERRSSTASSPVAPRSRSIPTPISGMCSSASPRVIPKLAT